MNRISFFIISIFFCKANYCLMASSDAADCLKEDIIVKPSLATIQNDNVEKIKPTEQRKIKKSMSDSEERKSALRIAKTRLRLQKQPNNSRRK